MKKLVSIAASVVFACILVISCSKSSEDEVAPPPPAGGGGGGNNSCDTVNMTYATHVKAILQNNCYACHGNGQVNGGVTLDSYAGVKAVADNGKLIGVITHSTGFPQMPQGGPKLSDCNINKIRGWINRGAPNN